MIRSRSGQLLLPIVALLFLFGLFWIVYVRWSLERYWEIKMDIASDFTALSAARHQAALLNYMATAQMSQNASLQKAGFKGKDFGHMQIVLRPMFEAQNAALLGVHATFEAHVAGVAQVVARANGANRPAVPMSALDSQLTPKGVRVFYFHKIFPAGVRYYPKAYFVRSWADTMRSPQPPHETEWFVCHDTTCGTGRARLWHDANPDDPLNNGGFPSDRLAAGRQVGFQNFYPQFNAKRVPKR
jgi:hypothetical protein